MGEVEIIKEEKIKLWNKNFFLLWQGQLVSVLGDVLYAIALEFWIFDVTKSTALMGTLAALTMLPRVILGPFAGVFVDRWDRKKIIVLTDFIRGIFVTFVGVAALLEFIEVWMVFIVGITNGLCSAFFNPAVLSVKPDIVHKSKIVKANSVTSIAQSGMDMLGNAIGGILYVTIGAPYMFLFNGISYIFSAFTEMFMKIPRIERKNVDATFKEDFKEGFKFIWSFKAFRNVFIFACGINLFFQGALILLVPYFKQTSFLGPKRYGFAMTILAIGMMSGSILLSILNLNKDIKYKLYRISIVLCTLGFSTTSLIRNYNIILIVFFLSAFLNVIFNTIFNSATMMIIPKDIRGKVNGINNALCMGLMPLGSLIGGVLGEIISIKMAILILFSLSFIMSVGCICVKGMKNVIEFEGEGKDIDELINSTNALYNK